MSVFSMIMYTSYDNLDMIITKKSLGYLSFRVLLNLVCDDSIYNEDQLKSLHFFLNLYF